MTKLVKGRTLRLSVNYGAMPGGAWSVFPAGLVTLAPAADGLSCVVSAVGPVGVCRVGWDGPRKADKAGGIGPFNAWLQIEVVSDNPPVTMDAAGG